jgi:hypothetical protein
VAEIFVITTSPSSPLKDGTFVIIVMVEIVGYKSVGNTTSKPSKKSRLGNRKGKRAESVRVREKKKTTREKVSIET